MKSMQRMAGKMTKRSADQQDVGAVIASFKATDDMLDRLAKDLVAWRNGWDDILKLQYDASEAFADLYKPIEPANDPEQRHKPSVTPQEYMQKCLGLQKVYSDMKVDLQQEITLINNKVIRPVSEAKAAMKSLHKTIKHRENMKLDYERYLSRAEHARQKGTRTPKDEAALAKHESDLQQAQIDYQTADDQVAQTFPPITEAVVSLLPHLLASQVMIQTTLVGQIYTSLDQYCRQHQMPTPAPGDAEIISEHHREFTSLRKELENGGIEIVSQGKAVHQSMALPKEEGSTYTGLGIRNKGMAGYNKGMGMVHRGKSKEDSSHQISGGARFDTPARSEEEEAPVKPPRPGQSPGYSPSISPGMPMANKPRMPSLSSQNDYNAAYDQKPSIPRMPSYGNNPAPYDHKSTVPMPSPGYPAHQAPPTYTETVSSGGATPSSYHTPINGRSPSASAALSMGNDYFKPSLDRKTSAGSFASSVASVAAGKKKPPPPVPVKRLASQQTQFVTALYDFDGQNEGDLAFREGDRIRVIKKTDSTDDWWEGENRGKTGSFPANYVQL
ncbi:hypothetical protein DOTSEDRAFT_79334 [Dothistroma septosporum NZE10]|uniref:SH3 domain-containing protein n=1 Tax=Dothistroma septosporum (strain NZE10 / CBS 128990) TaxID=675120 RepID=N1PSF1_DOTSN|nr:hypothetical protein DOTSEDRAFT_79334 [Dothistroma septosporum NZE10]